MDEVERTATRALSGTLIASTVGCWLLCVRYVNVVCERPLPSIRAASA